MKRIFYMILLAMLVLVVQLGGVSAATAEASDRMKSLEQSVSELISQEPGRWRVFIKDLKSKEEINIKSTVPGTSASVIKIWVAAEAYRQVENGMFSFEDKIILDSTNKAGGSGVLKQRPDGTEITYAEALDLMMVVSDNTATNILVEKLGWVPLNNLMKNLGCSKTSIGGLLFPPVPNPPGGNPPGYFNRTTAQDLGIVLEKLYHGQVVSPKADTELLNIMKKSKRASIAGLLPPDIPVARKGGSLTKTKVMHDAGIIFGKHTNIVVAVMSFSNNEPTTQKRSQDVIAKIGKLAYDYLDKPNRN